MTGFDSVARIYRFLEYAAFGRTLLRARLAFVDRLRGSERVLILGEGDGRFLSALVELNAAARIDVVDSSAAMLRLAEQRLRPEDRDRVRFQHADALQFDPAGHPYDAVVTLFFLDCFTAEQVDSLIARLSRHLRPGAVWLFADFAIPPGGLARWHARFVVGGLYQFFRWQTGLAARALPPSEAVLERAGFRCGARQAFRAGLVQSAVYVGR